MCQVIDEFVLVQKGEAAERINGTMTLSETAAFIYEHLEEAIKVRDKKANTVNEQDNPLGYERESKLLVGFAIPCIISMLVTALYNIVDQIFIGQGVGMLGNAATNIAFPLSTSCTAISLLLGIGSATNFSLKLGAGEEKESAEYAGNGICLMAIFGIALFAVTTIFLTPMLKFFGADVASEWLTASVLPDPDLHGNLVRVPGDISSAAYFIAAALIVPGSEVLLKNVGINPTRDGMLRVCRAMGADITLLNEQNSGGEPVADLLVRYTPSLSGTVIEGELIPTLIDEIPIIAVLAATANGTTVIRNAEELKVKESNRLDIMVNELTAMGVSLEGTDDGMIIEGGKPFHGAQIDSRLDHRIAMSFAIASLAAETPTEILRAGCVDISYPTFYQDLARLQA